MSMATMGISRIIAVVCRIDRPGMAQTAQMRSIAQIAGRTPPLACDGKQESTRDEAGSGTLWLWNSLPTEGLLRDAVNVWLTYAILRQP